MIPKVIHYIWLGSKQKPNLVYICINSWKKELPDYVIREWNEENLDLDKIAAENKFFAECKRRKLWAYMADYLRLKILYEQGGIYFDTDVQVLKSFDSLLNNSICLGMEAKNYIGTGMIACEPKNALIGKVLNFYQDEIWDKDLFTIPSIITYILDSNPDLKEQASIYPMEYFSPYDPWLPYEDKSVTENTYCIHWFQGGWVDSPAIRRFLAVKHIKNPLVRSAKILRGEIGAVYRRLRNK